jgi:hypothetical protein
MYTLYEYVTMYCVGFIVGGAVVLTIRLLFALLIRGDKK